MAYLPTPSNISVVRNDNVASFLGANLTARPAMGDSMGRTVYKPFSPDESTFSAIGSTVSTSVTLLVPSVIGKRAYVTDFTIANTGGSTTLVSFRDGSTSVIGYTIAPLAGGANGIGLNVPFKTAPSQDLVLANASPTSVLYYSVNGYQAP